MQPQADPKPVPQNGRPKSEHEDSVQGQETGSFLSLSVVDFSSDPEGTPKSRKARRLEPATIPVLVAVAPPPAETTKVEPTLASDISTPRMVQPLAGAESKAEAVVLPDAEIAFTGKITPDDAAKPRGS